jgi:20S proteasome subunit beta 6
MYRHAHGTEPSLDAISQLLSNTLYFRRFMPFYTFNLLCGVDEAGEGAVFGYDAIGSYDKLLYGC